MAAALVLLLLLFATPTSSAIDLQDGLLNAKAVGNFVAHLEAPLSACADATGQASGGAGLFVLDVFMNATGSFNLLFSASLMGTSGPLPDSLGLVLTDVCAPVAAAASGASSFPAPVISFPLGQTGWVEHSGWWLNKRLLETDGLVACSEDEVGYLEGLLNVTPEMTGGDDGTSYDEDADTGTEGSVDGGAVGGGVAGDGDSSSSGGVQDGTGLGGSTGAGGSTGSGGSTGTEGDGISGSAMAARSSSSSSSSNGMWETPPGGDSAGNSLDETFYQETTTKPLGRRLLSTRRHLALGALKEQLETAWKNLGDKLRGSLPRKNGSAGSAAGAGAAAGAAAGAGSAAESAVTYQILVSSKQSGAAWGGVLEGEKLPDLVI